MPWWAGEELGPWLPPPDPCRLGGGVGEGEGAGEEEEVAIVAMMIRQCFLKGPLNMAALMET